MMSLVKWQKIRGLESGQSLNSSCDMKPYVLSHDSWVDLLKPNILHEGLQAQINLEWNEMKPPLTIPDLY